MTKYDECLSYSFDLGLTLNSHVERKEVKGVYGMYATEPLTKGTTVASLPLDALLPCEDESIYPDNSTKWTHLAAQQLSMGDNAPYKSHVMMFESLQDYRNHSAYFFSSDEASLLREMSPLLFQAFLDYRHLIDKTISSIQKIDPELSHDDILQASLNTASRCWDDFGFLPIMDLFNHSDTQGVTLTKQEESGRISFILPRDYERGEQIWLSYGRSDIYAHLLNFNYFDPASEHFIDYATRAVQLIDNPVKLQLAEYISQHFAAKIIEREGIKRLFILEKGLFFFEHAPSKKLLDFFSKTGFTTNQEFSNKQCSPYSACLSIGATLDSFLSANKVDQFKLTNLPPKMHRFHKALKKERRILEQNKTWVNKQLAIMKGS